MACSLHLEKGMVQKRDSPDCVKVGYQEKFPSFEMGNKTIAVLVAHKGLLEVYTCIYSHVGPSTKDMDDSALELTGGGEMLLQPTVMPPLTFTLDDMENELQHYSVKTPLMQKCLR